MIRTIVVDDEAPAILKMKNLMLPYEDYQVVGEYTNPRQALADLEQTRPQVAFLDVAMPGVNGMDLALAIQQKMGGDVQIVFVSAYDEYALTAFEVRATDYLLKPVSRSRFAQTIDRLNSLLAMRNAVSCAQDAPRSPVDGALICAQDAPRGPIDGALMIRAFGKLEIVRGDTAYGSWRMAKVRELFAFFVHNRGQRVYRDAILETLWSHLDAEHALASMNTCNYYLRKHLEESGTGISLKYSASYYTLDTAGALCDADLLSEAARKAGDLNPSNLEELTAAANLYRGPYFEDVKCAWADLERKRSLSDYLRLRTHLAAYHLDAGDADEAERNAILALDGNQLSADAWRILLGAYHLRGDPAGYQQMRGKMVAAYRQILHADPPPELLAPEGIKA